MFRRGRSTAVFHLGDFEDTGERAQVPARFASNTTHRVHRSIEFLALRNGRRAGTYGNPESAVGVVRAPRPYRASPRGVPGRRGRGSSTADPKNDRTSFHGVSPPGALVLSPLSLIRFWGFPFAR